MALVELSVVEQRYRAVLEAAAGVPVTEVAARYEVSRQSVHAWIVRYREGGLGGLADQPKRPDTCPHQVSAEVEAVVCEMRRENPPARPAMTSNGTRPPTTVNQPRSRLSRRVRHAPPGSLGQRDYRVDRTRG
jgi:transposase